MKEDFLANLESRLIFERCGPRDTAMKFLLPLNTISIVQEAMGILAEAFRGTLESSPSRSAYAAVRF